MTAQSASPEVITVEVTVDRSSDDAGPDALTVARAVAFIMARGSHGRPEQEAAGVRALALERLPRLES